MTCTDTDDTSTTTQTSSTVPVLGHDLVQGIVDPKVEVLQQRLTDLDFDPGPIDGYFGGATARSVWARFEFKPCSIAFLTTPHILGRARRWFEPPGGGQTAEGPDAHTEHGRSRRPNTVGHA